MRGLPRPVRVSLEKAHDTAALQLAALQIEKKQPAEATKWLENVQFDLELKQKAKLMLAKIAFEKYFMWKARHGYVGLP